MLARHFNTLWCPEFAREYLLTNGKSYDFNDLLTIAKGQLALEEEYVRMVEPLPPSIPPQGGSMLRSTIPIASQEFGTGVLPGILEARLPGLKTNNPSEETSRADALSTFQPVNFSTNQFLFIDTDQYVMKVWCEYVFGDCHNWILRRIAERPYDLYLLCKPDLPWVKDELREYPDERPRQELFHIYRDILLNQPVSWAEINGSYNQRFEMAKNAVMTLV